MKKHFALAVSSAFLLLLGCGGQDRTDGGMADTTDTMAMDMAQPAAAESLHVTLSGGPSGDPDGSGMADITLNTADNTVCYEIQVENIGEPTAAHIHSGAAGATGPPVVPFDIAGGLTGCAQSDAATIRMIQASPSDFYLNIHTAEFGAGAVRGQLGSGM